MEKIYRVTDKIPLQIGSIIVKISPFTIAQKAEVQAMMIEGQKTADVVKLNAAMILALRYCVKEIQGLEDSNGPYSITIENGMLTESCADDLCNLVCSAELLQACSKFVNGIPDKIGIKGVEFLEKKQIPEA